MIRIQFGGTMDQLERKLMKMMEEWDDLLRWAIRNGFGGEKVQMIQKEKDKILQFIGNLRENKMP